MNYITAPGVPREEITQDVIVREVCKYFCIAVASLQQRSRRQPLAMARQIAAYLIRNHFDTSLKQIAEYMGGRDHTTIIHAIGTVQAQLDVRHDNDYKDCFEWLKVKGIPINPPKKKTFNSKPMKRIIELVEPKTPFQRVKGEYSNRQF